MERDELDHWARVFKDWSLLEDFVAFLNGKGVFLEFSDGRGSPNVGMLMDEYLEVDRPRLEQQRRALLGQQRAANAR